MQAGMSAWFKDALAQLATVAQADEAEKEAARAVEAAAQAERDAREAAEAAARAAAQPPQVKDEAMAGSDVDDDDVEVVNEKAKKKKKKKKKQRFAADGDADEWGGSESEDEESESEDEPPEPEGPPLSMEERLCNQLRAAVLEGSNALYAETADRNALSIGHQFATLGELSQLLERHVQELHTCALLDAF